MCVQAEKITISVTTRPPHLPCANFHMLPLIEFATVLNCFQACVHYQRGRLILGPDIGPMEGQWEWAQVGTRVE